VLVRLPCRRIDSNQLHVFSEEKPMAAHPVRTALLILGLGTVVAAPREPPRAPAADWPQWRGPNRDGVVHGVTVPRQWPKTLKEEWHVPVGEGYSSPVVVADKVYVFTRQKEDEVVLCLDLKSGKELWRSEPYPAPWKPGPGAPGDKRTRSTPTVAAGRVFTLGASGILSCLDAATGKRLWRKESRQIPGYGASSSPLVHDGLCITYAGNKGLTAFDVATGEVKWCHDEIIGPGYGSPILVDLLGERQVVTFSQGSFLGVRAATGKRLWGLHVPRFDLEQCLTPVLYKDLIIFAECGEPLRAIRLEKDDKGITPKEIWKAKGHTMHMSSPVLAGDWLFGFSSQKMGHLFCLDARTGQTLWQSEGRLGGNGAGYASLLNAGSVWLALTNSGHLVVVKPSGTAYEPIAEYEVADRGTDAHPVFLGDRIVIKDDTTLRCFRIEADPAAGSPAQGNGRKQTALDLQPKANHKLKEDAHRAGNNLAALPTGEQSLAGVTWKIGEKLILLSGKSTTDKPAKVEGIRVGTTFSKLYLLHATHWAAPEDTLVGYYLVNYEDKSQQKIPIVYGKDIGDWWYTGDARIPSRAEVAWKGGNDYARSLGYKIRLYGATWKNPEPARKVVSIDFASTNEADAAPFCVAITAEE
jgi:outer membrane protein assembly factor BamB